MPSDELAKELAATIRELGEARSHALLARANAWRQFQHLNVTERREEQRCATAHLDVEVLKLEAEVDALRVELTDAYNREAAKAQETYG